MTPPKKLDLFKVIVYFVPWLTMVNHRETTIYTTIWDNIVGTVFQASNKQIQETIPRSLQQKHSHFFCP